LPGAAWAALAFRTDSLRSSDAPARDDYFGEGDLAATERLCASVASATEMKTIRDAVSHLEGDLNVAQRGRLHAALNRL
jgi:hypothetical protein